MPTTAYTSQFEDANTESSNSNDGGDQVATVQDNHQAAQKDTNIDQNDHGNYAHLDGNQLDDNGRLTVSGWHATNDSQGRPYHYIIVMDQNGHEITRQNVTDNEALRPDVAQAFHVYGASSSGFSASFDLTKYLANLTSVQLISRYTNDPYGNKDYIDYWFIPIVINRDNNGHLDNVTVNNGKIEVAGWHATNLSAGKAYHYVILFDQTAGHEVARQLLTETYARPDITRAFPGTYHGKQSGLRPSLI